MVSLYSCNSLKRWVRRGRVAIDPVLTKRLKHVRENCAERQDHGGIRIAVWYIGI